MEFTRKKIPQLGTKGVEVHFIQSPEGDEAPFPPFAFIATPQGVRWEGKTTTIHDMTDLQDLARVASEAWSEHLKLRPKIEIAQAGELPAPGPVVL